ncbi:MAG: hypothetical protein OEV00_10245 [Acidobacteriota bacterium]|nr:hypothetical protein [Acidobacteriota bacterium]MDH3785690.1 hypothetical protein [Acidobacteriota bacterium]
MIVQCPSCQTAYRHSFDAAMAASQVAACGQCETQFPLGRRKAYRVAQAVDRQDDAAMGIGMDHPGLAAPLAAAGEMPEQPERDLPASPEAGQRFHPLTTVSGLATIGAAAGYYGPSLTTASWPIMTGAGAGAVLGLVGGWVWMRLSNRQN